MAKYQNKDVSVERPAREGDAGFDASKDMVWISFDGNSEDNKAVPKNEVKNEVTPATPAR